MMKPVLPQANFKKPLLMDKQRPEEQQERSFIYRRVGSNLKVVQQLGRNQFVLEAKK